VWVLFHQVVIATVFESSIFPSKKDSVILFIYPVNLIVKPLPRACEAGPTLTITGKAERQRGFFPMSEANVVYCFVR
jgi:hypothetical protein